MFAHLLVVELEVGHSLVMTGDTETQIPDGGWKLLGVVVRVGVLLLLEHVPVNGNSAKLILTGGKLINFGFKFMPNLLELHLLFGNTSGTVEVKVFFDIFQLQLDALNMEPMERKE